ncbi:hypothetical protein TNIN_61071 [Trichonephila inaurata madagascariensis]|uniref:Uncharacterized protein n=1 Tax=Trichonephila inaurata madagascariensis TaxID=2747483 RepID=A0A8X6YQM2_9ARAC|nr:hypothetical protein TNIN_61071 [Trichonephila inaurata madagascariensis]
MAFAFHHGGEEMNKSKTQKDVSFKKNKIGLRMFSLGGGKTSFSEKFSIAKRPLRILTQIALERGGFLLQMRNVVIDYDMGDGGKEGTRSIFH